MWREVRLDKPNHSKGCDLTWSLLTVSYTHFTSFCVSLYLFCPVHAEQVLCVEAFLFRIQKRQGVCETAEQFNNENYQPPLSKGELQINVIVPCIFITASSRVHVVRVFSHGYLTHCYSRTINYRPWELSRRATSDTSTCLKMGM